MNRTFHLRKREHMYFDYLYGKESQSYAFYKTPKIFFMDDDFKVLSTDAKILYGILLDRVEMSRKNEWIDSNNRVYVYMKIEKISEALGCCEKSACKFMKELEQFGLIEKKRQGQGKPAKIYVKNFIHFKDCNFVTSRLEKNSIQELYEVQCNNTKKNDNKENENNLILSDDERKIYKEILYDNMNVDSLIEESLDDKEEIESIVELMLDVICSKQEYFIISGDKKPKEVVKSRFLKINSMHLGYILDCLKTNDTKVKNMKQYMIATIYNAPLTIHSFYQSLVNNDMAEGRI